MDMFSRWEQVQAELKQKLFIPDDSNVEASMSDKPYVVGLDISYIKEQPERAVCTAVLLEYTTATLLDQETSEVQIINPYKAGFLAFRELDSYIMTFQNIMARNLDKLDLIGFIMLDGNGILHPMGLGLASHFGVVTGYTTIGCGKNLHQIDGLDRKKIKTQMDTLKLGEIVLIGDSGRKYGWAIRKTTNPIYISPGHGISIGECLTIIRPIHIYREPEPTKQADRISREYIRNKT